MERTDIVLGRGMVFFDRFADDTDVGEGERYIGNTIGFSIKRDFEVVPRLQSIKGVLAKRDDLVTRERISGDFVTDNITVDNASIWFSARHEEAGQVPSGQITETFIVNRGRYYQLGKSEQAWGVRHVENVTFQVEGIPLDIDGEILLDRTEGRFEVLADAATLVDGTEVAVSFEWRASPSAKSWNNEPKKVSGALRFIATNPVGPRKSYFFPNVTLTPAGEASLKGDEWQQLAFTFETKVKSPKIKQMYAVQSGPATYTEDELAIIELGGIDISAFPMWEDRLHIIVNIDMPSRNY